MFKAFGWIKNKLAALLSKKKPTSTEIKKTTYILKPSGEVWEFCYFKGGGVMLLKFRPLGGDVWERLPTEITPSSYKFESYILTQVAQLCGMQPQKKVTRFYE